MIATEVMPPVMPADQTRRKSWPWHWRIFLPVAASVVAGLTTLSIAIRYGDQPLPEMIVKTGPVQYGSAVGAERARELGISGEAAIDSTGSSIVVHLHGAQLPAQLQLRFWHPTEANRDQWVALVRGQDGSYRGPIAGYPTGLNALLMAPDVGWELPGSWQQQGGALRFTP